MGVALIFVPNPSTPSREHRLDAEEVFHLPGLENPAQRNPVTAELEAARQIGESKIPPRRAASRLRNLIRCLSRPD
jgi:hypothetical protein